MKGEYSQFPLDGELKSDFLTDDDDDDKRVVIIQYDGRLITSENQEGKLNMKIENTPKSIM